MGSIVPGDAEGSSRSLVDGEGVSMTAAVEGERVSMMVAVEGEGVSTVAVVIGASVVDKGVSLMADVELVEGAGFCGSTPTSAPP